jgi:hypothetical protein
MPDLLPSWPGLKDNLWGAFTVLALASAVSWGFARYKEAPAFLQLTYFIITEILIGLAGATAVLRFGSRAIGWSVIALLIPVAVMLVWDQRLRREQRHAPPAPAPIAPSLPVQQAIAPAVAPPPQISVEEPHGRVVVSVTPEQLWANFDGRTDVQAQKLLELYVGKWMKISGKIGDVSQIGKILLVNFERGRIPDYYFFHMYFRDQRFIDRLAVMQRGEHVDVLGRIDKVVNVMIDLEDCELV